jgi:hypothetical protein
MSEPTNQPPPPPPPTPPATPPAASGDWWHRYAPVIAWAFVTLTLSVLSAITGREFAPIPPPQIVENRVEVPVAPDGYTPTFGWVADPDIIAANVNPAFTTQFADTPAGKATLGDDDVFLWQAVRKVANRGPPWYPNVNQLNVGCCVGCGWKHGVDVLQAVQIAGGKAAEWKPVSVEAIYGFSRVEVGGGRISGDGSIGAWAAKAVRDFGVLPMAAYPGVDLSNFSPGRARDFGRRGVPDDLEPAARDHPVQSTALVRSWADVKRAIQQGYPVPVCSDQGFRMERDSTGRCRPQGTWNHCMLICGVRSGPNEGGFILNSWGDDAHTGPVWPADAPVAGFWADASVIDRMVRQGDSFAISDAVGFPAKKLNWFIHNDHAQPRRVVDPLARLAPLALVLAPEVQLAW